MVDFEQINASEETSKIIPSKIASKLVNNFFLNVTAWDLTL